jgi:hypothetical protein
LSSISLCLVDGVNGTPIHIEIDLYYERARASVCENGESGYPKWHNLISIGNRAAEIYCYISRYYHHHFLRSSIMYYNDFNVKHPTSHVLVMVSQRVCIFNGALSLAIGRRLLPFLPSFIVVQGEKKKLISFTFQSLLLLLSPNLIYLVPEKKEHEETDSGIPEELPIYDCLDDIGILFALTFRH